MNIKQHLHLAAGTVLCVAMAIASVAWAEEKGDMKFRGTLIEPPPCVINNGEKIDVDFGDRIGIKKVNGVNYLQKIAYRITCAPGAKSEMVLSLTGTATGFDKAAVQTNIQNLGIRIYQNSVPFDVGSVVVVDPASPPVLEAVPVGKPGAMLKEGAFGAVATLRANYQ